MSGEKNDKKGGGEVLAKAARKTPAAELEVRLKEARREGSSKQVLAIRRRSLTLYKASEASSFRRSVVYSRSFPYTHSPVVGAIKGLSSLDGAAISTTDGLGLCRLASNSAAKSGVTAPVTTASWTP